MWREKYVFGEEKREIARPIFYKRFQGFPGDSSRDPPSSVHSRSLAFVSLASELPPPPTAKCLNFFFLSKISR